MTVKSYGPTQIMQILIHVSFTLRNLINMGQLSPPLTIVILYIYNLFPCSYEMTAEIFGKQKVHSRVIRSGDDLSIYHILLFKAFQFFFFFGEWVGGRGKWTNFIKKTRQCQIGQQKIRVIEQPSSTPKNLKYKSIFY